MSDAKKEIKFRFTEEEYLALKSAAKESGWSMNKFVRTLVRTSTLKRQEVCLTVGDVRKLNAICAELRTLKSNMGRIGTLLNLARRAGYMSKGNDLDDLIQSLSKNQEHIARLLSQLDD